MFSIPNATLRYALFRDPVLKIVVRLNRLGNKENPTYHHSLNKVDQIRMRVS